MAPACWAWEGHPLSSNISSSAHPRKVIFSVLESVPPPLYLFFALLSPDITSTAPSLSASKSVSLAPDSSPDAFYSYPDRCLVSPRQQLSSQTHYTHPQKLIPFFSRPPSLSPSISNQSSQTLLILPSKNLWMLSLQARCYRLGYGN